MFCLWRNVPKLRLRVSTLDAVQRWADLPCATPLSIQKGSLLTEARTVRCSYRPAFSHVGSSYHTFGLWAPRLGVESFRFRRWWRNGLDFANLTLGAKLRRRHAHENCSSRPTGCFFQPLTSSCRSCCERQAVVAAEVAME